MKGLVVGAAFVGLTLLLTTLSRGDEQAEQPQLPPSGAPEPITGEPVMPNPGSEQERHEPFTPYSIGVPIEEAWTYEQLSASEKVIADHGLADDQSQVNAGYASAVRERSAEARGQHAARILGIVDVGGGVVP